MKKINVTITRTISGQKFSALENANGLGEYRDLSIDPNQLIADYLKGASLVASKNTLGELIEAFSEAPTVEIDFPV
jgi:hypothetical protein